MARRNIEKAVADYKKKFAFARGGDKFTMDDIIQVLDMSVTKSGPIKNCPVDPSVAAGYGLYAGYMLGYKKAQEEIRAQARQQAKAQTASESN